MNLKTKHFGEIEIDESKIIDFAEGLPGFESYKKFALFSEETASGGDTGGLFWWLQAVDNGDIAFVLMDALLVKPDYDPKVDVKELASLGEFVPEDLLVYNITIIPDDISQLSVNLRAPIIINSATKKGRQVLVNNEDYPVRCYIYDELKNRDK